VAQRLARLHDAHDGGVDLVEAVLQHRLARLAGVLLRVPARNKGGGGGGPERGWAKVCGCVGVGVGGGGGMGRWVV
jgi:hypothetical protein